MIIKICDNCGSVINSDTLRYLALSDNNPCYGCNEMEMYHLCVSCYDKLRHSLRPRNTDGLTLSNTAYNEVFRREAIDDEKRKDITT